MNNFLYSVLTYVNTNVTLSVLMLNGKFIVKISAFCHPVIQRIDHYPLCFTNTFPLDSDLPVG